MKLSELNKFAKLIKYLGEGEIDIIGNVNEHNIMDVDDFLYSHFQHCDKKYLKEICGISNAKDWNALSRKLKEQFLKTMQYL